MDHIRLTRANNHVFHSLEASASVAMLKFPLGVSEYYGRVSNQYLVQSYLSYTSQFRNDRMTRQESFQTKFHLGAILRVTLSFVKK